VLCCAGEAVGGEPPVPSLAATLLDVGLVLAEAVLDDEGRLVTVETLPVITPAQAGGVSARIAEWIRAALGG
jgi:hypothetical protein